MPSGGTWYIRLAVGGVSGVSGLSGPDPSGTYTSSGANGGITFVYKAEPNIYLNGSHAEQNAASSTDVPTDDIDLPLGFTVGSTFYVGAYKPTGTIRGSLTGAETVRVQSAALGIDFTFDNTGGLAGGSTGTFVLPAVMGGGWSAGVPFGGVVQMTGMTLLALTGVAGFSVTSTFANLGGSVFVITDEGAAFIFGTYTIVGYTWYFNPTTGQFRLANSDPGAPWRAQAAGVFDPPEETSPGVWEPQDPNEPAPDITAITPAVGCAGASITITGTGFGDDALVYIGTTPADNITVVDSTTITCDIPSIAEDDYDVTVRNTDGQFDTEAAGFSVGEPWWALCVTQPVDGIDTTYTLYTQSCSSPGDDWTMVDDPAGGGSDLCGTTSNGDDGFASNEGWYASTAAYTGDVYVLGTSDRPAPPRRWSQVAWAASDSNMLGGWPGVACVLRNKLVYAGGNYTQGTDYPPIRVYDGLFDRQLCSLPPTLTDTVPKAVVAMLAANGTVYLSTHDTGTSSADWRGRVFQLDLATGVLAPLGTQFAAGEIPYALCWHMGRLWCGTNNTIGTAGKVYYLRPGIDTSWTADYTLSSSSVGGCCSLASYNGKLYVGTDNAAASRGKVLVRDSAGAYTTSQTGSGGTARVNNGYLSLAVFGANLYAGYWNNDTTAIAKIEKFDGSSWSTAYTGSTTTLRPFNVLAVDDNILYALACANGLTGAILTTANGTSWTDRTANLPEATARELVPSYGVLVI